MKRGAAAAFMMLVGLVAATVPAGATKKPAATTTFLMCFEVPIGVIVDVNVMGAPMGTAVAVRPGRLTVKIVDTGNHRTIGTWTLTGHYSLLGSGPELGLKVGSGASGSKTDTLTVDRAMGNTTWSGPKLATMSASDLHDGYIGVSARFAGQPGYAASKSSTSAL